MKQHVKDAMRSRPSELCKDERKKENNAPKESTRVEFSLEEHNSFKINKAISQSTCGQLWPLSLHEHSIVPEMKHHIMGYWRILLGESSRFLLGNSALFKTTHDKQLP